MISEALQQFILEHREDDIRQLALQTGRYPDIDMREALVQISGWQKARLKLPSWAEIPDITYSEKLSLEQCSSETTAHYKLEIAQRICQDHHEQLADLTGGLAVDGSTLARHFQHFTYVEQQEALCHIALHNLPLLGINNFEVCQGRCEDILPTLPLQDLIFMDPARRDDAGRKVVGLNDCTPDVTMMLEALKDKCNHLMLKLSPMIDIKSAAKQLGGVQEVHVVAVDGECKEVLMVKDFQKTADNNIRTFAINTRGNGYRETFDFLADEEQNATSLLANSIEAYLYEPNAAVMKAGGFKLLTHLHPVRQLDANTHLYTSSQWVEDFPGRKFKVADTTSFSKKALKAFLSGMKQANLTIRNFPATVAELRKRLNLKEGGEDYVFATSMGTERLLVRCKKI